MIKTIAKIRVEHLMMLVRGLVWQLIHMRFGAIVLKGRGSKIWIDRNVALRGLIKVGDFAKLDLRYCSAGSLGPGFSLGDFSVMRASGSPSFVCPKFEIGRNVTFGPFCNIGGGFGLSIGDDVIAGPYVSIHPESHGIETSEIIRNQPIYGSGISVGGDCWLAAKSTILDGTTLPSGSVVGAGTILSGVYEEKRGIYVGVPARYLRSRPDAKREGQSEK